jgi:hypothetical protein
VGELISFSKATVAKVDDGLGLVFGWGIVCTEKGVDHYDLQGDHIPQRVMLEGVTDFMANARVAKDMHTGEQIGSIVHSFPLTDEIAKAFGIQCDRTGWLVAMRPEAGVLKSFRDGERTGFSIGGFCSYDLEEAA